MAQQSRIHLALIVTEPRRGILCLLVWAAAAAQLCELLGTSSEAFRTPLHAKHVPKGRSQSRAPFFLELLLLFFVFLAWSLFRVGASELALGFFWGGDGPFLQPGLRF